MKHVKWQQTLFFMLQGCLVLAVVTKPAIVYPINSLYTFDLFAGNTANNCHLP